MSEPLRCHACYDSFSGPWCDNCGQWPCDCFDDDGPMGIEWRDAEAAALDGAQ